MICVPAWSFFLSSTLLRYILLFEWGQPGWIRPWSSGTVQVVVAWYFVENIFSKRCTFWSARECKHNFPQYMLYVNGRFVQWRWSETLKKWLFGGVTVAKRSFLWYNFLFEQLNHIWTTCRVTLNCLWNVGGQIVSAFTMLTGALQSWNEGMWNATQLR